MDTRESQYRENAERMIEAEGISTPLDLARVLSLYIKVLNNNNGIVNVVSAYYIKNYDGKRIYNKYRRYFDNFHEIIVRNKLTQSETSVVLKKVAVKAVTLPSSMSDIRKVRGFVIEETRNALKERNAKIAKMQRVADFRNAVKGLLNLTYQLGYNEPSICLSSIIRNHTIDKYIMSGDFQVLLLPFLPDAEEELKRNYENYVMKDAWQNIKEMYYDQKDEFVRKSIEIKANYTRGIPNFSEYFDKIYTDIYYKKALMGETKK